MSKHGLIAAALCLLALLSAGPAWADPAEDAQAALQAYNQGRLDLALQLYNRALATGVFTRENRAIIHLNRGNVWKDKGQRDRAIADYSEAIRFNPSLVMAYNNRGAILVQKGLTDRAVKDLNQAIRLDPRNAMAYSNRGSAWQARGQYDRAIQDYFQAIRLKPDYADAYYNRGATWLLKGNTDRAIEDFHQAIKHNRNHVHAFQALARIKATSLDGRYRDGKNAVGLARHAVGLHRSTLTLDTLAAAYAEAGMFKDAVRTQRQAIDLLGPRATDGERRRLNICLKLYQSGRPLRERSGR